MPRFKLRKDCLFVDAYDLDEAKANPATKPKRKKQVIPHAHIIDKSGTGARKNDQTGKDEYPYTMLNDMAGFIGRFIVMGVETDLLLPQIVASEFGIAVPEAKDEVMITKKLINAYLEEVAPTAAPRPRLDKTFVVGQKTGPAFDDYHSGEYKLDFGVNPMGIGIFKG